MEEGSVPGLRKCVHGGMYVSEEEDLACVSTRRYWRVFVRQLSRYVCRHAYVCVCTCVRVCVCVHGGPGQGTADQDQYSQVPGVPRPPLPPSGSHCSLGGAKGLGNSTCQSFKLREVSPERGAPEAARSGS